MQKIYIKNFSILEQTLGAILKIVPSIKLIVNETGLTIHSCNAYARCSVFTNSVTSDEEISLCIKDASMLVKTLSVIKDEDCKKNKDVLGVIEATYDGTFIYINTKSIKTKIITVKEEVIQNTISKAVTTVLTPIVEFKTSSDSIKKVLGNSFMFSDAENIRVYLNQHDDLQQNCIYAEVTNKTNRLSNNITVKLGDITLGKVAEDIILDFERLSVFNLFKNDSIIIQLMDKPFLVANLSISKGDIYAKFTIYNSLRKS
jgi:hypothetical protein